MQDRFRYERRGRKGKAVLREFVPQGIVPRLVEELRDRDSDIPVALSQVVWPARGTHSVAERTAGSGPAIDVGTSVCLVP